MNKIVLKEEIRSQANKLIELLDSNDINLK